VRQKPATSIKQPAAGFFRFAAIAATHFGCPNCRFQPDSSHSKYIVSKPSQAGFW